MRRFSLLLATFIFLTTALAGCNLPQESEDPSASMGAEATPQSQPQAVDTQSSSTNTESSSSDTESVQSTGIAELASPGETFMAHVPSDGIGDLAVRVSLPEEPRYEDGAGVVVLISTYFTSARGFQDQPNVTDLGLIGISYLWPGVSEPTGARSEGTFDYGGEISIQALRDVIRFASGEITDRDGWTLSQLVDMSVLVDQVGLYAFSHPGIAAVNVLALHGDQLPSVGYFVGRENPTLDAISSVELGYWGEEGQPVVNPLYQYPTSYSALGLSLDYSAVRWDADYVEPRTGDEGRAYLDLNSNGTPDGPDFLFGAQIPRMYDKRFYSIELTRSLASEGGLTTDQWPADLATPTDTERIWPFHDSVDRYPSLAGTTPDLRVMLVFARRDHVQPSRDKPHIHHAFDGFHTGARLWTRLNPDFSYISWISPEFGALYNERAANTEPADWMEIFEWAYPDFRGAAGLAPMAAIAEMADRLHEADWSEDLDAVLVDFPAPDR